MNIQPGLYIISIGIIISCVMIQKASDEQDEIQIIYIEA